MVASNFFAEEGCQVGCVAGTLWHGLFENDAWRREFLVGVADRAGKRFIPDTTTTSLSVESPA